MSCKFSVEDRRRLAALAGISEPYLYQCLTGHRDMNPGAARRVEVATKGEVTRRDLCMKTWADIWPELADGAHLVDPPRQQTEF